jgi:hypothetical protein
MKRLDKAAAILFCLAFIFSVGGLIKTLPKEKSIFVVPVALALLLFAWYESYLFTGKKRPKFLNMIAGFFALCWEGFLALIKNALDLLQGIFVILFACLLIYLAYCFFSWIGASGVIIILLILILLK